MSTFASILDRRIPCGCGRDHTTRTRTVIVQAGALGRVPEWAAQQGHTSALVVGDVRTLGAAGHRVAAMLQDARIPASVCVVPDHAGAPPTADDEGVALVRQHIEAHRPSLVVAAGAGTINDLAKLAADHAGLPYATCPTAPSMNGYTSAIAAILSGGVKRTVPARQAVAVFADVDVLAAAPRVLRLAGFGDLCSKPFSNGDWYLGHALLDEYWCPVPAELLDASFRALLDHARGIGEGSRHAVQQLTETLLLSGFSMALAGSSSPASGGEHLLSHYWDMVEHAAGRPVRALHGLQVGVATVLTGRLYEQLLAQPADRIDVDTLVTRGAQTPEEREREVRGRHPLLPTAIVDEVVEQALAKHRSPDERRALLERLVARWPQICAHIGAGGVTAATIESALRTAGAPVNAFALGIDATTLGDTIKVARDIRSRFTVLDLAEELALLDPFADRAAEVAE